jgi:hypothetical protein
MLRALKAKTKSHPAVTTRTYTPLVAPGTLVFSRRRGWRPTQAVTRLCGSCFEGRRHRRVPFRPDFAEGGTAWRSVPDQADDEDDAAAFGSSTSTTRAFRSTTPRVKRSRDRSAVTSLHLVAHGPKRGCWAPPTSFVRTGLVPGDVTNPKARVWRRSPRRRASARHLWRAVMAPHSERGRPRIPMWFDADERSRRIAEHHGGSTPNQQTRSNRSCTRLDEPLFTAMMLAVGGDGAAHGEFGRMSTTPRLDALILAI